MLVKTGANLQDRDGSLHGRSEPRLSGLEFIIPKMGMSTVVPWTQEWISSAHAQTPKCTTVNQLSGWIKAWLIHSIIRYIQLSGLPLEPRCPDNRGSTVQRNDSYCENSKKRHCQTN